jgi:hypothetical protein
MVWIQTLHISEIQRNICLKLKWRYIHYPTKLREWSSRPTLPKKGKSCHKLT